MHNNYAYIICNKRFLLFIYHVLSKPNNFIGGKLAFQCQSSFSISPARHIKRKCPCLLNPLFSDQWDVFGPMSRRTNDTLFRTNDFWTDDTFSDQWFFGPMGFRTNGSSDQWVFGPMGRRTNELSDHRHSTPTTATLLLR